MTRLTKITLVLAVLSMNTYAQPFKSLLGDAGVKDLDLKIETSFDELSGQLSKAQKFSNSFGIKTQIELNGDLMLNLDAKLSAETGSAVSVYDEKRNTPSSKFKITHGYLSYTILDFISLKAGALDNRDQSENELLVNYGITSMGLRESVTFSNEYFKAQATATQARPYNDTLSQKFDGTSEGSPKFFSEIVKVTLKAAGNNINFKAGQFAYENISSEVAYNDRFYGNTVSGTTKTNSSYIYGYKGSFYGIGADINLGPELVLSPSITNIKNDDAPSDKNSGKTIEIKAQTKILEHKVSLSLVNFDIQSDTTIAYYNDNNYKNNYKGNEISFEITNPSQLKTNFSFLKREVNEKSIYLSDEKIFKISLGKTYDIF